MAEKVHCLHIVEPKVYCYRGHWAVGCKNPVTGSIGCLVLTLNVSAQCYPSRDDMKVEDFIKQVVDDKLDHDWPKGEGNG